MRSHLLQLALLAAAPALAVTPAGTLTYTSGDTSNTVTLRSQTGEPYLLHLVRYHGIDDQVILLELVLTHPGHAENLLLPQKPEPGTQAFDFVATNLHKQSTRNFNLPSLALKFQVTVQSFHTTGDCRKETTADCTLKRLQLEVTTSR